VKLLTIANRNHSRKALQDQAAWAIGNIAAEGSEYRDLLRANGVLIPLIRLLDKKVLSFGATRTLTKFAVFNLHSIFTLDHTTSFTSYYTFLLIFVQDVNLIQTVCFALSNLARGPDPKLDEFFKTGIDKILLKHLENDEVT
jgi:importin subunit alpha-6/7